MTSSNSIVAAGERIGRYRIIDRLGAGGMGTVYRAHDETLGRDVALKLLPEAMTSDPAARARLEREARIAATLNHPGICTIHEIGEDRGRVYIAMELVEGKTLKSVIGSGLPPETAANYGTQIADALAHAHERGVVHRDLKAANVVVTPEGRVKVLDFGIAKRVMEPAGAADPSITTETTISTPGWVVGTPQYLPPEVLRGGTADARSDLWSLGVLLYEMVSGAQPFGGTTVPDLAAAILNTPSPPLSPKVPAGLRAVIARLLSKDPVHRYQTAAEVRAALSTVEIDSGAMPLPARRPSALKGALIALGAVAGLVALYCGFLLLRGAESGRGEGPSHNIRALAVLPLTNLSGDPAQEYFADGMTEELITQLAPIRGLTVISRTSVMQYKGTKKTIPQIARELNVDGIVEGSVLRSGNQVRITAQLIDAPKDRHVWAESYERDLANVLALQGEVASDIASKIQMQLSPPEQERLHRGRAVDPEAYDLYLRARYDASTLSDEGVRRAIGYYQSVIERMPRSARAYSGIADAYLILAQINGTVSFEEALPKVVENAQKAIDFDSESSEANASMAIAVLWGRRDWKGAEERFKRAIEINPGYPSARIAYSALLCAQGRFDEGLEQARRAVELDPMSLFINHTYGWDLWLARRLGDAKAQAEKSLSIDPHFIPAGALKIRIAEFEERYADAIAMHRDPRFPWSRSPAFYAQLQRAFAAHGGAGYWQTQLDSAQAAGNRFHSAWMITAANAHLGRKDAAFRELRRAIDDHEGDMLFLKVDGGLDPLHGDPRFARMVRAIGLEP
jgi:eukaryotic-like serine/threonine-protein kinase